MAAASQNWNELGDRLADEFSDASYEQLDAFAGRLPRSVRPGRFVYRQAGRVAAAALVCEVTLPGLSQGLAYVKFGPMWRRVGEEPDIERYRGCLEALKREYCDGRGHVLAIVPRPSADYTRLEQAELEAAGFAARRPMSDPNRYLVRLAPDEDEQLRGLAQKWRYNLKQALKNGFSFETSRSPESLAAFGALYASMVSRKRAGDGFPLDLMPAMMADLPPGLRPWVALARRNGEAVAGAIVGVAGDTGYYLAGASGADALPLKAGYALQWWIARKLAAEGVEWYDLGGEVGDQGLRQFKSGFIGKTGSVVCLGGEYETWTRGYGRHATAAMMALRDLRRRVGGQSPRVAPEEQAPSATWPPTHVYY